MSRTRPSFSSARCGADLESGMEQFCPRMPSTEPRVYTLADFDFELPPALIAQSPLAERSASRLLDGRGELPVDRVFRDLPALLAPGDLMVFNDTQVIKARLLGAKASGGRVEVLVERV